MSVCVAFGCYNRTDKRTRVLKEKLSFFKFPEDQEMKAKWVSAVRRLDWQPTRYSLICSDHFQEEDIDRTALASVHLRPGAVPTIFPAFPKYLQKTQKHRKPPFKRLLELPQKKTSHRKIETDSPILNETAPDCVYSTSPETNFKPTTFSDAPACISNNMSFTDTSPETNSIASSCSTVSNSINITDKCDEEKNMETVEPVNSDTSPVLEDHVYSSNSPEISQTFVIHVEQTADGEPSDTVMLDVQVQQPGHDDDDEEEEKQTSNVGFVIPPVKCVYLPPTCATAHKTLKTSAQPGLKIARFHSDNTEWLKQKVEKLTQQNLSLRKRLKTSQQKIRRLTRRVKSLKTTVRSVMDGQYYDSS